MHISRDTNNNPLLVRIAMGPHDPSIPRLKAKPLSMAGRVCLIKHSLLFHVLSHCSVLSLVVRAGARSERKKIT